MKLRPDHGFDESGIAKHVEHMFAGDHTATMERYLDLCLTDKKVAEIVTQNLLTRRDLENISETVCMTWIKGTHVGLATIAYPETLQYFIQAKKNGKSDMEVAVRLADYWGRLESPQKLLNELKNDS